VSGYGERQAAITGIGQSQVGRRLNRDPLALTLDACLEAIADAGLRREDIDGLSTYPGAFSAGAPGFSGAGVTEVQDALRLELAWYSGGLEQPGQLGSIINATTPLWTAIILAVWLRQAPTARRVAAIAVGFAGVGVIVGLEGIQLAPDALVGAVAATAGAASYGLALTYMRRRMAPQPPLDLALGQLIAASGLAAAVFDIRSASDAAPSSESILAILGLGIFSTAIAWPILFRVNREVGPMATSTVTFLNPVFGALWGALFLAESISPTFLLGAALVFVSLMLIFDLPLPSALRRRAAAAGTVAPVVSLDDETA
jgi:hypothetical protein